MCNKTDYRIECYKCGYPQCEACYPDANPPLSCNSSHEQLRAHIANEQIGRVSFKLLNYGLKKKYLKK